MELHLNHCMLVSDCVVVKQLDLLMWFVDSTLFTIYIHKDIIMHAQALNSLFKSEKNDFV